jgi:hypothetical protein
MLDEPLWLWLLTAVTYGGPVIPMLLLLIVSALGRFHFWRNLIVAVVACTVQALSYLPFVLAVRGVMGEGDDYWYLLLPLGLGTLLFIGTLVYCIYECVIIWRLRHSRP